MGLGGEEAEIAASALDDAGPEFGDYLAEHPEEAWEGDFGEDIWASDKSLQHTFDRHGRQWGLRGNWNKAMGQKLKNVLERFYSAPSTVKRFGCYRGQRAILPYDPATRQCLVLSRMNDLKAAFTLSERQLWYVENTG